MIMPEQDTDVFRWGMDLLHIDPFSNSGYCGTSSLSDASIYDVNYAREGNFRMGCSIEENNEMLLQSLQQGFSGFNITEACGSSHGGGEQIQSSFLSQDWFSHYNVANCTSGIEGVEEAPDDSQSYGSSSSPCEDVDEGEDWALELREDFSSLDGELGKRLTQMIPIPHVPKINGEIPSTDEATSDHQRLLDRLQLYDLVELKVQGDGNCQFRALSDQFYRTPEHHKFVRHQIINQLKSHPEMYEGYVPMEYNEYLSKLSRSGEWGDHVTLQAAADSYGVKIFVITSFKDTCYIEILPTVQRSKRVIFLSFWAEVHYNSIYPEGDLPTNETKKKRRWWHFGNKH